MLEMPHLSELNHITRINSEEATVSKELKKLLNVGVLDPYKSPWASPLLVIKIRMVAIKFQ